MADSNFRGPITSMGALEDINAAATGSTVVSIQPEDGPSMFYQGAGFPDPRGVPFNKDFQRVGQVSGFLQCSDVYSVDAVPQAFSTTVVAAAQIATALLPLSLATVAVTNFSAGAASIAFGVPILAQGTSVIATAPIVLDFGFATGTTIANSTAVQVNNTALFSSGQWIILGNVGNAAGTASLMTQVQTTINATTIGVSPVPATALGVPIGAGNLFGSQYLPPATQFGTQAATALYHRTSMLAGFYRVNNPAEMLCRSISMAASTLVNGTGTFLVSGWDVHYQPMTQLVTLSGTTPQYTPKAFKAINTIVPQTGASSGTATVNVGIGDNFGFPFFLDNWAHAQVYAGNTAISNNVGFSTGITGAATNTTGDVRGTVLLSGIGTGTVISSPATTNNVLRLVIIQNMSQQTIVQTTPNNLAPMFGTANV